MKNSFRSEALQPKADVLEYVSDLWGEDNQSWQTMISELCKKRSKLIIDENIKLNAKPKGRILCFYPNISLCDGLVGYESLGFFDDEECPPWDIWFYFPWRNFEEEWDVSEKCFYSWVPENLINMIDAIIPLTSLPWLIWGERLEQELGIRYQENKAVQFLPPWGTWGERMRRELGYK